MNKVSLTLSGLAAAALFMTGCGGNKLDVTKFQSTPADKAKTDIPAACEAAYNSAIPKVAVVDFTNNSTFGKADVATSKGSSESQSSRVSAAGIGVTPGGIGAVSASKSNSSSKFNREDTKRSVDAKVSASVTDAVESQIVEMGGAKLFSRTNLEKIMKEQQLQQSGLMDQNTLVKLGKIAGVKYMVTGAINNVKQEYIAKEEVQQTTDTGNKTLNQLQGLANLAMTVKNIALSGMTVETTMTIKILDVETAEVLFSKEVTGTSSIGDVPNPSFDQLVGGLKEAAGKAMLDANAELSQYFKVRGYIVKLKSQGEERIAQINIGNNMNIKEGQEFFVFGFEETEDPISGKVSCDMTKLPVTLTASNQITKNLTWTTSEGDYKSMLRIGQLVERKPVER